MPITRELQRFTDGFEIEETLADIHLNLQLLRERVIAQQINLTRHICRVCGGDQYDAEIDAEHHSEDDTERAHSDDGAEWSDGELDITTSDIEGPVAKRDVQEVFHATFLTEVEV
ncbi:hypothetical protein PM082_002302 [Marasmius tenuissimus]|nr:hypothetical protein PM082_002302 [Marasmius tenuissimus]